MTLDNSTLSANSARRGGGLYLDINSQAAVNDCVISGNSAGSTGGGGGIFGFKLSVANSTITGNSTDGSGGGIFAFFLTVTNSTISNNTARYGGGGIAGIDMTVTNSTISDNSTGGDGGGILKTGSSKFILANSTVNGNSTAGQGRAGGIWLQTANSATPILVINSTISGNTSNTLGGGIYGLGGTLTVAYSTITNNMGGGVFVSLASLGIFNHTIVAGNHPDQEGSPDVTGIINASYSLIGLGEEYLGPLADNGGPTLTHALLPRSPAINAGDPSAIAGINGVPHFDQRAFAYSRVVNGRIDIGAFEFGATSADFDEDGDVDGWDFLLWQRGGSPNPLSGSDLALWQGEYGTGGGLLAFSSQLLAGEDWVPAFAGMTNEIAESERIAEVGTQRVPGFAELTEDASDVVSDEEFWVPAFAGMTDGEAVDRALEELGASTRLGKPAVAPFGEMVAWWGVKGWRN